MKIRHTFSRFTRGEKHAVVLIVSVHNHIVLSIELARFPSKNEALACIDRIHEALGAPF